jgi:hypothetical protein
MYDISVVGGDAGFALGFELATPFTIYIAADLFAGTRGYSLGVRLWRLGTDLEWRFGRLRLGCGIGVSLASADRATQDPSWGVATGVRAGLSFDFARWDMREEAPYVDRAGAFVSLQLHAEVAGDALTVLWGPSVGLGIRL